ncbi:MAG: serine hydrolase domain-containing protein [Woeseiaceae bacterium]
MIACSQDPASRVDALFAAYTGTALPGAAVLVIRDGEVLLARGYGMANLEEAEPVTPATGFRLASVTKQFTAMCVLMLADRGQLSLDETMVDVFPDFPEYGRLITMRNLLQHTSGLIDYEPFVPEDSPDQVTDRGVLDIMRQQTGTYFVPGSEYRYSNSAYAVLSQVVETRSGKSFATFLTENIFEPLGMDNTVAYQKGISTVANRAYGYAIAGDAIEFSDQSPWSAVLGDGGIYSSINDLYRWDQALYTEALIPAALFGEALEPNLEDYGYGWRIDEWRGHRRMHHDGSTSGFRNFVIRFPDERLSVFVLTNRREPDVQPLAEAVAALYADHTS